MKSLYRISYIAIFLLSLFSCGSGHDGLSDGKDSPSFALKRKVASMLRHDSIPEAMALAEEGLQKYPDDLQLMLVEGFLLHHEGKKEEAKMALKRAFAQSSDKDKMAKKKSSLTDDLCKVLCIKIYDEKGFLLTSLRDQILQKYENSQNEAMPIVANIMRLINLKDIEKSLFFTGSWLYLSDDECLSPTMQMKRLKRVLVHEAPQAYRDDMNQFKYIVNEKGQNLFRLHALLCPDDPEIPFAEGLCLYSQKDYRGAQACWKRSLDICDSKPDSLDNAIHRALCLLCLQGKRAYQEELDRIEANEAYKRELQAKNDLVDMALFINFHREITLSTLVRQICEKDEQGNPIEPEGIDIYNL